MAFFAAQGAWSFTANSALTPSKSNWKSIGSSNDAQNSVFYNAVDTTGWYTFPETNRFIVKIFSQATDFFGTSTTISGTLNLLYTFNGGSTSFAINTTTINNTLYAVLDVTSGDKIAPSYTLNTTASASFSSYSLLNAWEIRPGYYDLPITLKTNAALNPTTVRSPITLDFIGTLSSGYKVVLPITREANATGTAIFKEITNVQVTVQLPSAASGPMSVVYASVDPLPADFKTVTVSLAIPAPVSTLLASSNVPTATTPPVGCKVFLRVSGN